MSFEYELLLMQQDNEQARSPYAVIGPVWPRLQAMFRERLKQGTNISLFNSSFASYPIGDQHYMRYAQHMEVPTSSNWYVAACDAFMERLRARDTFNLIDKIALPIDWDYLCSLEEVISMVEMRPALATDELVVLDLGAGWGRIGHVLCTLNPNLTYVACDIPESLIVAQTNLPTKLSNVASHPYSETRHVAKFDRTTLSKGLWFCGTQALDAFDDSSIDVFVNTFSFQEMTMQQVTEYFEVIDRVAKGGILYTQQRKQGDEMSRDNYPYLKNWKPCFDRDIIFSPVYFEAGFVI